MMSTLAKSAIVAATVAGASATRLRVEVAAKTNFEDSLQMTSFETSFIEKAFEEHDCVGTTMEQLDDLTKKSAEELTTLEAECEETGSTSKFQAAQDAHDLKLTHLDQLEKQRTDGIFPVIFACAGFDMAAANMAQANGDCDGKDPTKVEKQKYADNKAIFDDAITKSDERIAESSGKIADAKKHLKMVKKRETDHDTKVANDIVEKSKDYDNRISNIASQLKTDKKNLETNKNNDIEAEDDNKKAAEAICDQIKDARDEVIKQDKDLLEEIKGHLETLKICTAAHAAQSSGTAFLEIKAAQRLEAHCAVSRKMVEQATPTGDITDWSKKIEEEIVTAAANKEKCYAAAEEVERFAVHGPAVTEDDTVSGIMYVYNKAVLGKESVAQAATSDEEKLKGEMEAAENKLKVPYQTETQEAQLALDQAKNDHCDTGSLGDHVSLLQVPEGSGGPNPSECVSGVMFQEWEEKKLLTKEKFDADDKATEQYDALLVEQKSYLDGKRTALVKAFDVVKLATENECKESIQDLKDEKTLIAKVRAKIGALQVVHGGSGGGPSDQDSYVKKKGYSCNGRNELGFKDGYTVKQCEQHCSKQPTCISFEKFPTKCKFSESCKEEISKKDDGVDLYLRADRGNATGEKATATQENYPRVPPRL